MVTKKVRTEYMKKFKDPKWETFSKCYEDSVKYRLTRRVIEHSHKPWFWEGWDSGSDSSGWSTPRLTRNKITPLSLPPPPLSPASGVKQKLLEMKMKPASDETDVGEAAGDATVNTVVENGVNEASGGSVTAAQNASGPSNDVTTDNGPADTASSDGEPAKPAPKRRPRRRRQTPCSEPGHPDSSNDEKPAVIRKPSRAKSQPPIITKEKENHRPSSRLDWTQRQTEVRRTHNDSHTSDACVQTRRVSDKRSSHPDRRRARSADLEKTRRSELTVVDDRWMTEYMRCFSARLR